jgi:hypothetical protein
VLTESPVFYTMFKSQDLAGKEIEMAASYDILRIFLMALKHPVSDTAIPDWAIGFKAINLARRYECTRIAEALLFAACLVDPMNRRRDAFVLACELDHLQAACRLLRLAGSGEKMVSIHSSNVEPYSLRPRTHLWTQKDTDRLSPRWIWALTAGAYHAEMVGRSMFDARTKEFWVEVTGKFMSCLSSCKFECCYLPCGYRADGCRIRAKVI